MAHMIECPHCAKPVNLHSQIALGAKQYEFLNLAKSGIEADEISRLLWDGTRARRNDLMRRTVRRLKDKGINIKMRFGRFEIE